jgi:hypothetical protein
MVKGREIPIESRREKEVYNWGKAQQMPRVDAEGKSKKTKTNKQKRYWIKNKNKEITRLKTRRKPWPFLLM